MRSRTTRALAAAGVTALLAAGCGGDGDENASAAPTVTASPATTPLPQPSPATTSSPTSSPEDAMRWSTCLNDRAEVTLQVSYPQAWTARDYPDDGCSYFNPEPFEVQRGTEASGIAIRLDVEPTSYDRVREGYLRGDVQSQRKTEVAGFPALRIEDEQTRGPSGPKGQRLTYLADLGTEETLVLTTNETDADKSEAARRVLDEMAERLERAS
jgi:hypothetical protein